MKSATIVVKVEQDLKDFLQNVADQKGMSLSEYARHVLARGLDAIAQRNRELRALEKELKA